MKKLENLGRNLSKDEQKRITGGYSGGCLSSACTLTAGGVTYSGYCNYYLGPCLCSTSYGLYEPAGGKSSCAY